MRTQSDGRLVALLRLGEQAAFDEIVRRYREPLARYCRRLVGESQADEAVQQAFVDAWRSLSRGGEVRELRPWLYRVAFHAALRPVASRAEVPLPDDGELGDAHHDEVESRIETHAVLAAVAGLPTRQRDAIVLTMRGFASDEVGHSLGLSDGAARQLVHRARATLRAGATAVTPWPLIARMIGGQGAEVVAGAGSTGLGVVAVKLSATILVGGAALGGSQALLHGGGVAASRPAQVAQHAKGGEAAPARAEAAVRRTEVALGEEVHRAEVKERRRRAHDHAPSGSSAETVAGVANPASGDGSSGYDATAADASGSVDDTPADDPAPDDATDAGADPNPDPPPDDTPPPDEGPPPDPTP